MVDHVDSSRRSWMMAQVHGKNTKPEKAVRRELHRLGFRFRLHRANLPGKPDIVLPKYRTAIFVHGCFWHRHPGCSKASTPQSNSSFWSEKFARNVERDLQTAHLLRNAGWDVRVVWECETKKQSTLELTIFSLLDAVLKNRTKRTSEDIDEV
ncbi:very short patch repair endonuclease [Rhizobium ruizarguesonis]|jgi:DNA mismatch endonuclease (patch repair protein)|uniref:very short patch repair endonuclease n=1 Tax=Rhizobium ruizarguesonis TaxID=2081791 RepID=UPI001031BF78|nr:DNA mismatch endonuclease Vsr [Rhizobium ruizarguesonis]TAU02187.1 DNA mismatch endonuclease Vsr [Rhizobium ruizarguesonis]